MSRVASSLVGALLAPDPGSHEALHRQIYSKLRAAILSGRIGPGAQIPSSRELARELCVGRNTVLNAVEQLTTEGYLQGEQGSGTFVTHTLPEETTQVRRATVAPRSPPRKLPPLSLRARELTYMTGLLPPSGNLRPFLPCVPAVDRFPFELWGKLVQKQWRRHPGHLLGLGEPAGHLPLRRVVAEYLANARAVDCDPEQVIIVSGAQQALDLVSRVLIEPGDAVWIEEPGYQGVRATLSFAGAKIVPVPVDEEGLNVQAGIKSAADARMVYVTPSHQFPLGHTMSLARRLELLAWARKTHAWILEDDYDSEYRYTSRPIPALQGLAKHDQVLYVGTLSKVLYPSLRLGYLVVPRGLAEAFATARTIAAGSPSLVDQAVLAEFIADGHFGRHLRRMRALYLERREVLLESAHKELRGLLEIHAADAGLHAVGWPTAEIDDGLVVQRSAAVGIDVMPLSSLYAGRARRHGLVLGFAAFNNEDLRAGMAKLRQIFLGLS